MYNCLYVVVVDGYVYSYIAVCVSIPTCQGLTKDVIGS